MNDVELDKQIADVTAACDLNRTRVEEIQRKIARLGYELHIGGNKDAGAQIDKLLRERSRLGNQYETLLGAIDGLRERKAAAQAAAVRDADEKHARNALVTLESLLALAPKLDELVRHPRPEDGQEFYCQNDPPTCCKAAELIADLVNNHLHALHLAEVTFPKHWHGAASKMDLERELMKTIAAGWPYLAAQLAPRQRSAAVMPGQPPRTPEFTKILNGWGAVIRKNLAQHAQATEIAA
jgi:hypothetical protein